MASGGRINTDQVDRFSSQLESVYASPFTQRPQQPQTAEEIKHYIVGKMEALINGSDDAGGEDRP